jgi:alpha-glucosidase
VTAWSHDDKLELEKQYIQELRPVFHRRALFSDTTGEYVIPAEPKPYEKIKIRFRTAKDNVDYVYVIINKKQFKMVRVDQDEQFDYYEAEYQLSTEIIKYYFEVHVGKIFGYYDVRGFANEVEERMWFRVIPGFSTPDWAKGAVMYQIFVDRFYNGDKTNDVENNEYVYINDYTKKVDNWFKYPAQMGVREFYGGDLQGVLDKMDYLQELGIEALYFNPLFVSPSNHKYDIQDYDYIDPHIGRIVEEKGEVLGQGVMDNQNATKYINRVSNKKNLEASNELFIKLVEEAHKRGMKVIMDGVFNHCGSFNKWMDRERIYENTPGYANGAFVSAHSPYRSFFEFKEQDKWPYNKSYEGWWGHETLPKLNYEESKQLEDYILYIGQKWVSPPYNIDGWRLDVAADLGKTPEYNHEFWCKFRKKVKSANPNALILAEHYGDTRPWLQGNEWDSVMNYDAFMEPLTWFLTGMQKHSDSYKEEKLGDAEAFWDSMAYHSMTMPSAYVAMNELSNHDHSRFLTRTNRKVGRVNTVGAAAADVGVNTAVMREAVLVQMTWPGAPTVYYGDEAGLCGFTDPDNRRAYPWGKEDKELIKFHKEMIAIHKKHQELKTGSIKRLKSEKNFLSYGRFDKQGACVILLNNSEESVQKTVSVWELGIPMEATLTRIIMTNSDTFTTEEKEIKVENGKITVVISKTTAAVLKYVK